jgi:hypothetical protein
MSEETGDQLIAEDWPTYFTQVPVWILTSGISAQAYMIYAFLAEHVNSARDRQRIACPKQMAIARILGIKKRQNIVKYVDELKAIGALRVEEYRYQGGMRRGYRYRIRFNAPATRTGHSTLGEWYDAHPDVRGAKNEGRTTAGTGRGKSAGHPGGPIDGTSGGTPTGTAQGSRRGTAHGPSGGTPKLDQGGKTKGETLPPTPKGDPADAGESKTGESVSDEDLRLLLEGPRDFDVPCPDTESETVVRAHRRDPVFRLWCDAVYSGQLSVGVAPPQCRTLRPRPRIPRAA